MNKQIEYYGNSIAYRVMKNQSAQSFIVFLHGWGGNSNSFAHIEAFFAKHYSCIFISFPMFQLTDVNPPKEAYTLDIYADITKIIVEKECGAGSSVLVIAHSFGARVAVKLASSTPTLFDKLLLTGAAGIPPQRRLYTKLRIRLYKLRRKLFKTSEHGKGSEDYRCLTPAGKRTFQNILKEDLRPQISDLSIPTLLIFGKKDKSTPLWMGKYWTRICKTSKLLIYEGAGHFCFIDCPSKFIIDAQNFFDDDAVAVDTERKD